MELTAEERVENYMSKAIGKNAAEKSVYNKQRLIKNGKDYVKKKTRDGGLNNSFRTSMSGYGTNLAG